MSTKEHDQEISRLKSTLKLQYRLFQQSAEIVRALKNGLHLQYRMKEQESFSQSLKASLKSLEVSILV